MVRGTGALPPVDTLTVNTRESMGRSGMRSGRVVGGGTARFKALCVALLALVVMDAQAEGVKKLATVSNTPRARWGSKDPSTAACRRERTRLDTAVVAEAVGVGVGVAYAKEAMPVVSLMGALPHCTSWMSTVAPTAPPALAVPATTGPAEEARKVSISLERVREGGGWEATTEAGRVTGFAGMVVPREGRGTEALQPGRGLGMP